MVNRVRLAHRKEMFASRSPASIWPTAPCASRSPLGSTRAFNLEASPNLNGKVEGSRLTDEVDLYQLLDYTDDVDLRKKLAASEEFYNVHRPHGGLGGKTPYETLREKMAS